MYAALKKYYSYALCWYFNLWCSYSFHFYSGFCHQKYFCIYCLVQAPSLCLDEKNIEKLYIFFSLKVKFNYVYFEFFFLFFQKSFFTSFFRYYSVFSQKFCLKIFYIIINLSKMLSKISNIFHKFHFKKRYYNFCDIILFFLSYNFIKI